MLMVTSPHSGETIPPEAKWLQNTDPLVLLCDVDRYVDQLYQPGCDLLNIPLIKMEINRYVLDLNRLPTDIDSTLVEGGGAALPSSFVSGYHWAQTTLGQKLLHAPISKSLHEEITRLYFRTFHEKVLETEKKLISEFGLPRFHLDAHSMPSVGKGVHRDSGKTRPDIVVSDCSGKSCKPEFKDLVIKAFDQQGLNVAYNWPYLGGRMTESYGKPYENKHSVQVELNRALYLDEVSKEKTSKFAETREKVTRALQVIRRELPV